VKTESAYERAIRYSRDFGGKVGMFPKVPITSLDDFTVWYTPGVAAVSRRVDENPDDSFTLTNRWNSAAIVSDGSRVLGLGRLRPEAALPVLEGKALIFKYLGGVDAIPLSIRAPDPEAFVRVVEALEPSFGAINLEDIESPKCFYILEELRRRLTIPVWHDDQLGTAGVVLAALYGALDVVGRGLGEVRITLLGAGAANIATARILQEAGADVGKMRVVDSRGILHPEREDIDELLLRNRWKYELAIESNRERVRGGIEEALRDVEVLIAASRPGPGVVKPDWIRSMARDPIVFALANPVPEIMPQEALEAGAAVVATGRSDFPNQVNNSLLFPSMFRGILDVRGMAITNQMVVAAAREIYNYTKETGLSRDRIVPTMMEWEVYPRVAAAVGEAAVRQGLARKHLSRSELLERARLGVSRVRKLMDVLLASGLLPRIQ
jgi:malate dehydrogenase (oxaloacetate-decarboxylating)